MNNKIYSLLAAATLCVASTSCDNWTPNLDNEGSLLLSSMDVDVKEEATSRATVDVSGYTVAIKSGDNVIKEWIYSEMPEIITLPVGEYTAEVKSHEVQKQEWDKPYYVGSKAFKIVKNTVTEVGAVTCTFAGLKVTIGYDADLYPLLGDDCQVTVLTNDAGKLVFAKDEKRAGYFEVVKESTTIVATLEGTIDGKQTSIQRTFTDVKPGSYYHIVYKKKGSDVIIYEGDINPEGIGVDTNVTNVNTGASILIEETIIDNPGEKPGQEGEGGGGGDEKITFKSSTLSFDKPNSCKLESAVVNIASVEGISNLNVAISSDSEAFMQSVSELLPLNFDLAHPGDFAEAFASLGFPVGDQVIGAKELEFNISQFVPLLGAFPGTHTFKLEVVDKAGNKSSVSLTFIAQ